MASKVTGPIFPCTFFSGATSPHIFLLRWQSVGCFAKLIGFDLMHTLFTPTLRPEGYCRPAPVRLSTCPSVRSYGLAYPRDNWENIFQITYPNICSILVLNNDLGGRDFFGVQRRSWFRCASSGILLWSYAFQCLVFISSSDMHFLNNYMVIHYEDLRSNLLGLILT